MSVIDTTSKDVSFRLGVFYLIILVDVVFTSFVELSASQTVDSSYNSTASIVIFVIQAVCQVAIFIWFVSLFWSTVLLKYGLVGLLLKNFKWSITYILLSIVLNFIERLLRLVNTMDKKAAVETEIWDNVLYRIFYYVRFANLVPFYLALFSVAKRITRPEYYKPSKWLSK